MSEVELMNKGVRLARYDSAGGAITKRAIYIESLDDYNTLHKALLDACDHLDSSNGMTKEEWYEQLTGGGE